MAKKTKAAKITKKGRGGRKPGVWTLVTPEQIRVYRKTNGTSRAKLADMLGVSNTTVQNWETGKGAAFPKIQERIKALLDGAPQPAPSRRGSRGGAAPQPATSNGSHAPTNGYDSTVEATGRIVAAFLGGAKIQRQELGAVIREVRSALG
jgi:DNA-binding XRE family transcriptional regulator